MSLYLHFFVYTKFLPTFGNATFARSGIREACCDVQLMYYRSQFSGDEIRLNGPGWISQIYQVGKVVMAEPGQEAVEACASGSGLERFLADWLTFTEGDLTEGDLTEGD